MMRLLNLPYRTHNVLINAICPGIPAEGIIHNRFIKFIRIVLIVITHVLAYAPHL